LASADEQLQGHKQAFVSSSFFPRDVPYKPKTRLVHPKIRTKFAGELVCDLASAFFDPGIVVGTLFRTLE